MWRMRPPSSWTWHLPSAHGFGGSCAMKKARGWAAPPAALASFSAMIFRFFTLTMRTSLESTTTQKRGPSAPLGSNWIVRASTPLYCACAALARPQICTLKKSPSFFASAAAAWICCRRVASCAAAACALAASSCEDLAASCAACAACMPCSAATSRSAAASSAVAAAAAGVCAPRLPGTAPWLWSALAMAAVAAAAAPADDDAAAQLLYVGAAAAAPADDDAAQDRYVAAPASCAARTSWAAAAAEGSLPSG